MYTGEVPPTYEPVAEAQGDGRLAITPRWIQWFLWVVYNMVSRTFSFAEMYIKGGEPLTVTIATISTLTPAVGPEVKTGYTELCSCVDGVFTVEETGVYHVSWSAALQTTTAGDYVSCFVSRNTTAEIKGVSQGHVITANQPIQLSGEAFFDCIAGDTITLAVLNYTAARDITIVTASAIFRRIRQRI